MRSLVIRLLSLLSLAGAFVAAFAYPAAAAGPILANEKYKWFYWIGPILGLSFVGLVAAMGLGYYVRVLRPKWRGRQSS